ncbi:MAG: glycerol-3-phosphate 1-O-acyltransferase PlsY [Alphaproteobacteria bacterium]
MDYNIYLLLGYLLGSIPFGLVLCYLAGYGDIRKIGSGNIGTTNVLRTGNKFLAIATLLLDSGKGAIAVCITALMTDNNVIAVYAGLFAVIGHNFPVWLKFKGGKGVATTLGTILFISPAIGGSMLGVWIVTALLFKMSSLAGILAVVSTPLFAYMFGFNALLLPFGIIASMTVIKHRANIVRIINGTEDKIKLSRK